MKIFLITWSKSNRFSDGRQSIGDRVMWSCLQHGLNVLSNVLMICSTSQFLPYIKCHEWFWGGGGGMVFNHNFNNISVILLQSVLLVEEIGVPGENQRPAASHWQTLSLNVVTTNPRMSGVWTDEVNSNHLIDVYFCLQSFI
jgi:hypothetical protein